MTNTILHSQIVVHDLYVSHHMDHMPPILHASSVTPPHQIHNPTPSYPPPPHSSHQLSSPSHYHTTPPAVSSSLLSESNSALHPTDSVNASHLYGNSMNLPPTPNSLVTMIGPNSNHSNSNEASSTPTDTIDANTSMPSTPQHNNLHANNHYSPWATSSNGRPPLSPDGSTGLLQPLSAGVNGQMHHHIAASPLSHPNQASSFMQQSLHPFSHHSQMSKNFGMTSQYYPPWYWCDQSKWWFDNQFMHFFFYLKIKLLLITIKYGTVILSQSRSSFCDLMSPNCHQITSFETIGEQWIDVLTNMAGMAESCTN